MCGTISEGFNAFHNNYPITFHNVYDNFDGVDETVDDGMDRMDDSVYSVEFKRVSFLVGVNSHVIFTKLHCHPHSH